MTSLAELHQAGIGREVVGADRTQVSGVHHDSRKVSPNDLFVAIPGANVAGAKFAQSAVANGASAVLATEALDLPVPQILSDNPRRDLARAAELVYGNPTAALPVVGLTGTNGKTTTTHLLSDALEGAGFTPAVLGTIEARAPGIRRVAEHTTPEGDDITRFAAEATDAGASHLLMEVSSHGLAMHRVDGVCFDVAAFTNLTQDHLDFHETFEDYGEAKARLFTELMPNVSVVVTDSPFGESLAKRAPGKVLRCAQTHRDAEISVSNCEIGRNGIVFDCHSPAGVLSVRSPLVGRHNVENLLVVVGVLIALNIDLQKALAALGSSIGAPGRLERVHHPRGVLVLVDYAHTPDALTNAMQAVKEFTEGQLWVVFGCGGDRDKSKRPLMGAAVSALADRCVITSDNPRTEDPRRIVDAIHAGAKTVTGSENIVVEVDRRKAIEHAIQGAKSGDTVLIAGKGHEDYQIVGTEKRDFDDRVVAAEFIARQERP